MGWEVAQSHQCVGASLLTGKCTALSYQNMGRLHRWPALGCLLPVWTMSLVLRAALAKLKKSMLSGLSLKAGQTNSENTLWTQPSPLNCVQGANLTWSFITTIHSLWLLGWPLSCTNRKNVSVNPCFVGVFGLAHLAKAMWRTSQGECSSFPVSLLQLSWSLWSTVNLYSSPLLTAFRLLFRQHYLQLSLAVHQ